MARFKEIFDLWEKGIKEDMDKVTMEIDSMYLEEMDRIDRKKKKEIQSRLKMLKSKEQILLK